jgi:hypothetical protein
VVSFTPQLFYSHEKSPWYLLGRRLGRSLNWSGHWENSCTCWDSNPNPIGCAACSQLLYLMHYPGSHSILIYKVSKRGLQWYFKCFCVMSVTKTFTLKGIQTITSHLSRCCIMDSLYAFKYKRISITLTTQ